MAINQGDGFIAIFLFEGLVCARSGSCSYIITLINRAQIVNINDAMEGID